MFRVSDKGWMLRHGLGLVCAALVLIFAALHALAPHTYLFFTRIPDGAAKLHPFVDLRAILQGGACWRQGVDVYRPSACLDGGVFNYSPLLLRVAYLPIGPEDTLVGGLLFCAAYAAALATLPPPRNGKEWALYAACAFSPVAYYALEQGNLDALIFALIVLALRLPWRWRAGAYAIFAAGAAAKFYPASLFILALRESRRMLTLLAGAGGIALALAVLLYGPDLLSAVVQLPSGTPFRASFGRIDLPRGLAMLHFWPRNHTQLDGWALALLALGISAWRRP
ncbi:MAG TPA: glycosyltransferase 87 family protein, partial [Acidocella sp.]|nr:glycosyltransferase 87 family protein [Acidocella sp.]